MAIATPSRPRTRYLTPMPPVRLRRPSPAAVKTETLAETLTRLGVPVYTTAQVKAHKLRMVKIVKAGIVTVMSAFLGTFVALLAYVIVFNGPPILAVGFIPLAVFVALLSMGLTTPMRWQRRSVWNSHMELPRFAASRFNAVKAEIPYACFSVERLQSYDPILYVTRGSEETAIAIWWGLGWEVKAKP